ncbi:MAG: metallophosphoesterase [Desertifilum sp.]|nr:metallophosphoesterase [Desertifilum sp.]
MPKFLHVADVHLGFDRYDRPERTTDFFLAFKDALEKYAIAPAVDFVLIAGDLFEHRHILPATLNQAEICLDLLQEAGIPALTIEGNHDNLPYGTKTSWLRYLAESGKIILLEPSEDDSEQVYQPWDKHHRRGGYIDLECGVRVFGSRWYGASAPQAIRQLATAMTHLPAPPPTYGDAVSSWFRGTNCPLFWRFTLRRCPSPEGSWGRLFSFRSYSQKLLD